MDENMEYLGLVVQAQNGDQESMTRLAELAEGRILAYIYRLTLDYDLARDLFQETMLEMVRSLWRLRKTNLCLCNNSSTFIYPNIKANNVITIMPIRLPSISQVIPKSTLFTPTPISFKKSPSYSFLFSR